MTNKNNVCKFLIFILLIYLTKFHCASSQQCGDEQWECDDGECIPEDDKCNGKVDCRDRSDEIAENCIHLHKTCPDYSFKCLYGACIAGNKQCNKKQNCADNSDELNCDETDLSYLQGRCSEDQMQCLDSKECINSENVCNGRKDCTDGSDETVQVCVHYGCGPIGFQCGYGACISNHTVCNGKIECADGSDEAWELCNTPRNNRGSTLVTVMPTIPTRPTPQPPTINPSQTCQIPNNLPNIMFKLHPSNKTVIAGSFVKNWLAVHMECQNGLVLQGRPSILCKNGNWNDDFPKCIAYCDGKLLQGLSTRAICDPEYGARPCKNKIYPNTTIQINCNIGYKFRPPQIIRCMPDGTFDNERIKCDHNCGRTVSSALALSKHGIPTIPSAAPWHVAIYEYSLEYVFFCSGSIISPRIVISAAHCFYDHSNFRKKRGVFQVIAGKISNTYETNMGENPQIVDIAEFHVPKNYTGSSNNFLRDIAIVILKTPLQYNENISAICMPFGFELDSFNYVISDIKGFVSGFGIKNKLEKLNMITISAHKCREKESIAADKFCIFNEEGASVCRGESGGGFVKAEKNNRLEVEYNLLGVISNTPNQKNDCVPDERDSVIAVTAVSYIPHDFVNILNKAKNEDEATF